MSVQAGNWNFDGRPPDRESLFKISQAVAEYGPDGETTYFDASVGMLYRPFHTTPESRRERQPHVSASRTVVTWDGRLDNRDEVVAQLHGLGKKCKTDLAIVAAAFDRWGVDCFAKLVGDWAVAVWNPFSRKLILARDYAGIRHLFYYPKPTGVDWCTHLEPLALCGDRFTLCDEYFAGYLALRPDAHRTPYTEIHAVPPGGFVSIANGAVSVHSYWTFHPQVMIRYKTDPEYEEHFRHLLRQAVRQRMHTDSPILADLSGGLDSSAIVCMADDILAHEGANTPVVDTFTALVRDEPSEEDSKYFTAVEEKRGRAGHRVDLCDLGDESPFEYSRFVATPGLSARPELNAAKAAIIKRGNYRVLLSGTGGDEMLGQALDPRVQLADLLRRFRLVALAQQLCAWSLLLRRPWIHLFFDALVLQLPTWIRIRKSDLAEVDSWVNGKFARAQRLSSRQLDGARGSLLWRPSARDWFQTVLTLTQQMAAARPSTEETRYPYLDQRLVEFLVSIPTEQLLRPGQRRSLMRRALADMLPAAILERRTKSSGTRYLSAALAMHWDQLEGIVQSPVISQCGFVNQERFYAALLAAKNGQLSPHFVRLFKGLSWELWLRKALAERVVSIGVGAQTDVDDPCGLPTALRHHPHHSIATTGMLRDPFMASLGSTPLSAETPILNQKGGKYQ